MLLKKENRIKRHKRVRARIYGTINKPRFCVFRSNKHIYAQLIDDENGKTLISAKDLEVKHKKGEEKGKNNVPFEVGKLVAKKSLEKNITTVVFDRGGY